MQDYGRQWHCVLPCLLWALREVPNQTTAVSPHFLLFGGVPRGPLSILIETWTGMREHDKDASKPVSQYIREVEQDMKNAEKICTRARTCRSKAVRKLLQCSCKRQSIQRRRSSGSLRERFCSQKKLLGGSKGEITIQLQHTNARWCLQTVTRQQLRPFVARVHHVGIINDQDAEFGAVDYSPVPVNTQTVSRRSCHIDMNTLQHLDSVQCQQLSTLLDKFDEVFADSPGLCTAVEHEINVTSDFRPRMHNTCLSRT